MEQALNHIPKHLGIIMDGNGRWAKMRGMSVVKGHQKGAARVKEIVDLCKDKGVKFVSLYAFSTENWLRPRKEVNALMNLLVRFLEKEIDEINSKNSKLMFAGRRSNFSKKVLKTMEKSEELTKNNTGLRMILCIDYGGRQEIADAASRAGVGVTPEDIGANLYLPDVPDMDLLIRTSGEERISNFMLWQSAYSELYFTDALWPDFDRKDLEKALNSYRTRQRRYGARG